MNLSRQAAAFFFEGFALFGFAVALIGFRQQTDCIGIARRQFKSMLQAFHRLGILPGLKSQPGQSIQNENVIRGLLV